MKTPLFYEVELRTDDEIIELTQFRHKEPFIARTKAINYLVEVIDQSLNTHSSHFCSLVWNYDKGNKETRELLFCSAVLSKYVRDRMQGFNRARYLNKDMWPLTFEREYRFYNENRITYFGWEEVISNWGIAEDRETRFPALPQSETILELAGFPVKKGTTLHSKEL